MKNTIYLIKDITNIREQAYVILNRKTEQFELITIARKATKFILLSDAHSIIKTFGEKDRTYEIVTAFH